MSSSLSERDIVEQLAEEFVARHRRGEYPSLSEYVHRCPERAEEIRDLFPALVVMEQLKPGESTIDSHSLTNGGKGKTPERLGDFRLLREVGRGGMGVVYEAEQISLGRHVALKVLPAQGMLNPTHLERFRREAKAAARLHHTNIVPVFGVGESDGVHYYAMQFIRGEGLDTILDEVRRLRQASISHERSNNHPKKAGVAMSLATGRLLGHEEVTEPLSTQQDARTSVNSMSGLSKVTHTNAEYYRSVARVGLQVAEALAHAHKQGVLHRDIKSSNLLIDEQGTVWVTDFGLAKESELGNNNLTQTGDIVGTIRFMAPERFEGQSLPQSDLYSLGITLYEMVALKPAFDASHRAKLVEQVLQQSLAPLSRINRHVPRDLETIISKCTSREVRDRYPDADALADDLRRFLADRPIKARRATLPEQLWRWSKRNPTVAAMLTTLVSMLILVAIGSLLAAANFREQNQVLRDAQRQGRLREAEAQIGRAHGIRNSRQSGQRFEALAALRKAVAIGHELAQPAEWFNALRNEAIAALALPDLHICQSWQAMPPGSSSPVMDREFERYAYSDAQGSIRIHRVQDQSLVSTIPSVGEPVQCSLEPGGFVTVKTIDQSHRFWLWEAKGTLPKLRINDLANVVYHDLSADGNRLAVSMLDGTIETYDTGTGLLIHRFPPGKLTREVDLRFHPTEPLLLVFSYFHQHAEIRDSNTGITKGVITPGWSSGMGGCNWSPNGKRIAVSQADNPSPQLHTQRIRIYDFTASDCIFTFIGEVQGKFAGMPFASFDPSGELMAARGWNGNGLLFDVSQSKHLITTQNYYFSVNWRGLNIDASGRRLAGAVFGPNAERIGIFSLADGREYRFLTSKAAGVIDRLPTVHPGGRLVAHPQAEGGYVLVDLQTSRVVGTIPHLQSQKGYGSCVFDGTGALLTNDYGGCYRWPIRFEQHAGNERCVVGPPVQMPFHAGVCPIAASADGQVIAQCMWNGFGMSEHAGGWFKGPNVSRPVWVNRGQSCGLCSVSPDGRWVLIQHEVFDSITGKRVWTIPNHGIGTFSRDSKSIITTSGGGQVFSTDNWQPTLRLGPGVPRAVSPDNSTVLFTQKNGCLRLVELRTGRELALLEGPEHQVDSGATFSHDGSRIIVASEDGLHVWDLQSIRSQLREMGLDWDAPEYPPVAAEAPNPLQLQVFTAPVDRQLSLSRISRCASR
ncbi:MAG: WD40 repeat domain-containing serine/threonine-protein kinase [Gemmatales bacterium]